MLKVGFEREYFIQDNEGQYSLAPVELPHDGCGWLAEARGMPFTDIEEAVFSLLADERRITKMYQEEGLSLLLKPVAKIGKHLRLKSRRAFMKDLTRHQNLYGHQTNRLSSLEADAGVHISFTKEVIVTQRDDRTTTVNGMFDFVKIFRELDRVFAEEIRSAKRKPGFYEVKPDGRVEYRSLPNDIDLLSVADALNRILGY